jgi:type II secretory pathway pseudopilin PulG
MKSFSKNEVVGLTLILAVIVLVSLKNFQISLRRARDAERKQSINTIANALAAFQNNHGYFPPSEDGKIKACTNEKFDAVLARVAVTPNTAFSYNDLAEGLRTCEWGKDGFGEIIAKDYPKYLDVIPLDPRQKDGFSYEYFSNGRYFQLYSSLEGGVSEDEYRPEIAAREFKCGSRVCNFGRGSYGKIPLDKTIQEYENELMGRNK